MNKTGPGCKRSLEIRQSKIYYAGLLGRWDKRLVDQESDIPTILLEFLIDLRHSNLFIFIFVVLLKKKINKLNGVFKEFCKIL